jgi:hypothetical protein
MNDEAMVAWEQVSLQPDRKGRREAENEAGGNFRSRLEVADGAL